MANTPTKNTLKYPLLMVAGRILFIYLLTRSETTELEQAKRRAPCPAGYCTSFTSSTSACATCGNVQRGLHR
ncbi:uncharacterized protein STAUR_0043 [Stigmatella aurantiaca DW4/3-1]|uniref:Uncharacterized protein n=1 Tax=Stigmatella aurantiaca (strain DW4/3-1) TaxID=378806 RepID=Q09D58_STIAD|nr:uncharacterized protein STAUR_0043 [Stigmatella aurantiaca DW4/3-1]EAU69651.1 hypothetical protein STIAU_2963 [Stigmatella aurantiaca DW4/3-1]